MNESSIANPVASVDAASEEDLACRVQDGCADSFEELVRRVQPRLLFVLRRRLGNETDAEDVTQKTLLRVFEKIHLYKPPHKFSPWLFTIALRLATDHHRKKRLPTDPTGETAAVVVDPRPGAEQIAIDREQASDLWTLAEKILKPEQWTALWLLYGEGQSVREVAQALNRTSVSIRVLLYRARKTLTPHLAAYSPSASDETTDGVAPAELQFARAET